MGEVKCLNLLARDKENQRYSSIQHLELGLRNLPLVPVPSASLKIQTVREDPIFRLRLGVLLGWVFEVEAQGVDWNLVLSCIILRSTSRECLCEIYTAEPEVHGRTVVNPILEE